MSGSIEQKNGSAPGQSYSIGNDPALSAQVRKELLDTLKAKTGYDPESAERELESYDIHAEFLQAFGGRGLTPDNLPDLLAAHLMAMWTVVHDAALPGRETATGLATQFARQIAGNAIAADPVKRQLMGEALRYETVLTLKAQQAARDAGDKAKLKEMAESAQRNILNQRGINLRKTRLTASGMVRA